MQVLYAGRSAWSRQASEPWQAESIRRHAFPFERTASHVSVGELFDSTWQSSDGPAAELKSVCTAFVHRLRDDGRSPEQVLVALKREIAERGALHLTPSLCIPMPTDRDRKRSIAYNRLFHWFLEAYFDDDRFADPGPGPK